MAVVSSVGRGLVLWLGLQVLMAVAADAEQFCVGTKCYMPMCGASDVDWAAAKTACETAGMTLASITSAEEHAVAAMAQTYGALVGSCQTWEYWIGLKTSDGSDTEDPNDAKWEWTDGSAYSYQNFDEGQPASENCGHLDGGQDSMWEGEDCDDTIKGYLCQGATTGGSASCLHPRDEVRVEGVGRKVAVEDVKAGDKVMTVDGDGALVYEEVYAIAHKDLYRHAQFVEVEVEVSGGGEEKKEVMKMRVTPGHHVITEGGVKAAGQVSVGEVMYALAGGAGDEQQVVKARVSRVTRPTPVEEGVVSVFTKSGRLLVQDLLAGEYVEPYPPGVAHLALYPARMAASILGQARVPDTGDKGWLTIIYNLMKAAAGVSG